MKNSKKYFALAAILLSSISAFSQRSISAAADKKFDDDDFCSGTGNCLLSDFC
ncbi:MAG: hypothetical protein ACJAT1_001831 [Marivirga sp.]